MKISIKNVTNIAIIGLMIFYSNISSAEGGKVVEVSGVGVTLQSAKEDAIRQAVESVVSSYVSSDLIMQNEAVIKDKVINYSAGFIEKMDVLSQSRNPDGLISVKIRAVVTSQKIKRKLEEQNISTSDLDSNSMFASAVSQLNTVNSATILWKDILSKFPSAALEAKVVGSPSINPIQGGGDKVQVVFNIFVKMDETYASEFISLLNNTSTRTNPPYGRCSGLVVDNGCYEFADNAIYQNIGNEIINSMGPISIISEIKGVNGEVVEKSTLCLGGRAANPFYSAANFYINSYAGMYVNGNPRLGVIKPRMNDMFNTRGRTAGDIKNIKLDPSAGFIVPISISSSKNKIPSFKTVEARVEKCSN